MRILITNDDGINAPGIQKLAETIKEIAEITVVAPIDEQSAVGHAITLSYPLRIKKIKNRNFGDSNGNVGYAINGTPADCVKIALKAILPHLPDLIISGINTGANIATDIIYSGTVSAATEGTIFGIPSIAISLGTFTDPDFSAAAQFAKVLAPILLQNKLPPGTFLNVNVPAVPREMIRGIAITKQGKSRFIEKFEQRIDPRQNTYFWQGGEYLLLEEDKEADGGKLKDNYISITPIHYDLTDYKSLDLIKDWKIEW